MSNNNTAYDEIFKYAIEHGILLDWNHNINVSYYNGVYSDENSYSLWDDNYIWHDIDIWRN